MLYIPNADELSLLFYSSMQENGSMVAGFLGLENILASGDMSLLDESSFWHVSWRCTLLLNEYLLFMSRKLKNGFDIIDIIGRFVPIVKDLMTGGIKFKRQPKNYSTEVVERSTLKPSVTIPKLEEFISDSEEDFEILDHSPSISGKNYHTAGKYDMQDLDNAEILRSYGTKSSRSKIEHIHSSRYFFWKEVKRLFSFEYNTLDNLSHKIREKDLLSLKQISKKRSTCTVFTKIMFLELIQEAVALFFDDRTRCDVNEMLCCLFRKSETERSNLRSSMKEKDLLIDISFSALEFAEFNWYEKVCNLILHDFEGLSNLDSERITKNLGCYQPTKIDNFNYPETSISEYKSESIEMRINLLSIAYVYSHLLGENSGRISNEFVKEDPGSSAVLEIFSKRLIAMPPSSILLFLDSLRRKAYSSDTFGTCKILFKLVSSHCISELTHMYEGYKQTVSFSTPSAFLQYASEVILDEHLYSSFINIESDSTEEEFIIRWHKLNLILVSILRYILYEYWSNIELRKFKTKLEDIDRKRNKLYTASREKKVGQISPKKVLRNEADARSHYSDQIQVDNFPHYLSFIREVELFMYY